MLSPSFSLIFSLFFLGKAKKGCTFASAFESRICGIEKKAKKFSEKRLQKVCFKSGKGGIFAPRFIGNDQGETFLKKIKFFSCRCDLVLYLCTRFEREAPKLIT